MIPELGSFAIILALLFCLIQSFSPIWGYYKKNPVYFQLSTISVAAQFIFLIFAMLCLIVSFINNDMTVVYVHEHSHSLLPLIYRIGAAWGGHEGSLLLWCLILSAWSMAFVLFANKNLANTFFSKIIMVLGFISTGFLLFLFLTSNPFQRNFPETPVVGNDLTPLLQDPGLIFHPPMLYLGYVGFAIGFAFAIAALIEGKFDKTWAFSCKPWIIMPWAFLGCGIVLGSWWAYRELGWGGWWFWDPVENASLLPWLAGTALIHSLIVAEKRAVFKGWVLLLAIITFGLSLIGTFLVRSGVLVSVHTFASDPSRGIFLLSYLAFIIGGAFLLYSFRIKLFYQAPRFQLFSRETLLLINSVILLVAMATIVIGTLYPIILDALGLEKISVGEPYFNIVFVPIMLPLLLLMGFAPHTNWGKHSLSALWKKCRFSLLASIALGLFLPWLVGFNFQLLAFLGITLGLWIIIATGDFAIKLLISTGNIGLSQWAMIVAHVGVGILALGITINKSYSDERQLKILPGETTTLAGYLFTFKNISTDHAVNYQSTKATFAVQKKNDSPKEMIAEQRIYRSHDQSLSKPGILFNSFRDLYLALGNSFTDGGWSIRIYYKPCVRWIWFGGFLLLAGGMLSLFAYLKKRGLEYDAT